MEQALRRSDCLIASSCIHPAEIHWGAKSESIGRILETWNIGADSVVFIDDSPLELAEVQAKYPTIECLLFDRKNPEAMLRLFWNLRELFGKPVLTDEDRMRASSLRSADLFRTQTGTTPSAEFLSNVGSKITIDYGVNPSDRRAFELVNKTNQFNLNGRRFSEAEWNEALRQPRAFSAVVSYEDKFGLLGKIAVILGDVGDRGATIHTWVMSCRAFGRNIEYQILHRLFGHLRVSQLRLSYMPTERNGPLREFLASIGCLNGANEAVLGESDFRRQSPPLSHEVKEVTLDDIQNRLTKSFATTFPSLRPGDIPNARVETLPEWDSVAHLTLLAIIGEEFGMELDLEEFQETTSFKSIQAKMLSLVK